MTFPRGPRPQLRVFVVTESFLPQVNGVTNSVQRALQHLAEAGHQATVVAPSGPEAYAGAKVHHVRHLSMPSYKEFPVGFATQRRLRRLIEQVQPDVVHLASPAGLGHQAGQAARSLGIPVVAVYQTDLIGFAARYHFPGGVAAMRRLTRRIHQPASLNLAPSSAARQQLRGLGIDNVAIWGRGVDAELFHPDKRSCRLRQELGINDRQVIVGYVGRLAAEKELELLANVATMQHVQLVIVGGGPEEKRLKQALPQAAFLGVRRGDDLARTVASFDVFAHTGRTETFCQAAQEALSCGVPVIAPRAGGPIDLVTEGLNGLLFTPGDATEFADAVRLLTLHPPLRQRMGLAARRGVQSRSWPAINDQLIGHYRAVLDSPVAATG